MDHKISTKGDGLAQIRGGVGVIHNDFYIITFVSDLGNGFNINQAHIRIGGCFKIDDAGFITYLVF